MILIGVVKPSKADDIYKEILFTIMAVWVVYTCQKGHSKYTLIG
jgi:hypothetical protein